MPIFSRNYLPQQIWKPPRYPQVFVKPGAVVSTATTVTIPTHVAGDLIIIYAFASTTTIPGVPASGGTVPLWTQAASASTVLGSVLVWAVAAGTTDTSGTWSSTSAMMAVVCSKPGATPIGGIVINEATESAQNTAPAITLARFDGSSAILSFFCRATAPTWSAAPTDYLQQSGGTARMCLDSKISAMTDGSVVQANSGGSLAGTNCTVEIRAH